VREWNSVEIELGDSAKGSFGNDSEDFRPASKSSL
jgi:hypothetical protein